MYLLYKNEIINNRIPKETNAIVLAILSRSEISYINSLNNKDEIKQLREKKDLLKVQKALLILAEKEAIFTNTKKWQNILTLKIQKIENTLQRKKVEQWGVIFSSCNRLSFQIY